MMGGKGVAIWWGLGGRGGPDIAARTRPIVNENAVPAELRSKLLGNDPSDSVASAAGRERHHHFDLLRGVTLCGDLRSGGNQPKGCT
jgi:hypothetical protein